MRVVVTGGAGVIGRAVVRHLADRVDKVTALVRDEGRAAHLVSIPGLTLVQSDLSSSAAMAAEMASA